jgi:hypothetical protein
MSRITFVEAPDMRHTRSCIFVLGGGRETGACSSPRLSESRGLWGRLVVFLCVVVAAVVQAGVMFGLVG